MELQLFPAIAVYFPIAILLGFAKLWDVRT